MPNKIAIKDAKDIEKGYIDLKFADLFQCIICPKSNYDNEEYDVDCKNDLNFHR